MDKVSVVIPYKYGDPTRDRSLDFVMESYQDIFSLLNISGEMIVSEQKENRAFNKSRAINHGVEQSNHDLIVIADGDMVFHTEAFRQAIDLLKQDNNSIGYICPFNRIHYLHEVSTIKALSQTKHPLRDPSLKYRLFSHLSCGGCNILTRKTFEVCRGFDERFDGWGYEDNAWDIVVTTFVGKRINLPFPSVHFNHQKSQNLLPAHFLNLNKRLYERYHAARQNKNAVSRIVSERFLCQSNDNI